MTKTILITGSTDGIGKLAAIQLATAGHVVYVHGRNQEKLERVITEVQAASQNNQVSGFVADFSDLEAVRQMANQILLEVPHLDVLINNAGVFNSPVQQNGDGLDVRFVVNYLAPYVLTHKLLPLLKKQPGGRVLNLSSAAQDSVSMPALRGEEVVSVRAAYGQSKLALTMWSALLAKQWPDLTIISVNPGSLLNTRMVQEAFGQHWAPADKGADILFRLATEDQFLDASGKYFDNDRGAFGQAHPDAYDEEKIFLLAQATDKLLGGV